MIKSEVNRLEAAAPSERSDVPVHKVEPDARTGIVTGTRGQSDECSCQEDNLHQRFIHPRVDEGSAGLDFVEHPGNTPLR